MTHLRRPAHPYAHTGYLQGTVPYSLNDPVGSKLVAHPA
jgi:hypothetical protein